MRVTCVLALLASSLVLPAHGIAPILAARLGEAMMKKDMSSGTEEVDMPAFDMGAPAIPVLAPRLSLSKRATGLLQESNSPTDWTPSAKDWSVLAMPRWHPSEKTQANYLQWKPANSAAEQDQVDDILNKIPHYDQPHANLMQTAEVAPPQPVVNEYAN